MYCACIHDSGEVAKTYRYDAFGNEETPEPLDANPFRYCGEYFDAETATLYLRARSYDARSGRFTQEDSAKDGGNWYAYCANNPLKLVDPSGNIAQGQLEANRFLFDHYLKKYNEQWKSFFSEEFWNAVIDHEISEAEATTGLPLETWRDQEALLKWESPWFKDLENARAFDIKASVIDWSGRGVSLAKGSLLISETKIDTNKQGWYLAIGAVDGQTEVGTNSLQADLTLIYFRAGYAGDKKDRSLRLNLGSLGGGYKFDEDEWTASGNLAIGFKYSSKKVTEASKRKK